MTSRGLVSSRFAAFLASLSLATLAGVALAGDPAPNAQASAAAEALFDEGRTLLKEKKYAQACPKLAESLRLDPAVGTMLYLADCYEKNGQTASAWSMFSDAMNAAHNAGQGDREKKAKQRVDALAPKLVKLSISVASASASLPGLEIKRDGILLGPALFGTAVPVDPGDHKIEVTATGKKPWRGVVTVPDKAGTSIAFPVPALEDAPPPPTPEPTTTATATAPTPTVTAPTPTVTAPTPTVTAAPTGTNVPPLPTSKPEGNTARTIGLVVGSLGVAGIAAASGLGLVAKSKNDEALAKYCEGATCTDQKGIILTQDAKGLANASTVAFVISGVALAAGAALIIYPSVAKPSNAQKPSAGLLIGPGSIGVHGRF